MSNLIHPQGDYLSTAVMQSNPEGSPLDVDISVTDHEEIEKFVQPLLRELGSRAEARWIPAGLRLTFATREEAVKFRLTFVEPDDVD